MDTTKDLEENGRISLLEENLNIFETNKGFTDNLVLMGGTVGGITFADIITVIFQGLNKLQLPTCDFFYQVDK